MPMFIHMHPDRWDELQRTAGVPYMSTGPAELFGTPVLLSYSHLPSSVILHVTDPVSPRIGMAMEQLRAIWPDHSTTRIMLDEHQGLYDDEVADRRRRPPMLDRARDHASIDAATRAFDRLTQATSAGIVPPGVGTALAQAATEGQNTPVEHSTVTESETMPHTTLMMTDELSQVEIPGTEARATPTFNVRARTAQNRLALNRINLPPTFTVSADEALVASIRTLGIIEPVVVRAVREGTARVGYEIIDGARRVEAARQLGLMDVPCLIVGSSTPSHVTEAMTLAANTVRAPNVLRELEAIESMQQDGVTLQQIEDVLHIPRRVLRDRLRLRRLLPSMRARVADGTLTPVLATLAARLSPEMQMVVAMRLDGNGNVTAGYLRRLLRTVNGPAESDEQGELIRTPTPRDESRYCLNCTHVEAELSRVQLQLNQAQMRSGIAVSADGETLRFNDREFVLRDTLTRAVSTAVSEARTRITREVEARTAGAGAFYTRNADDTVSIGLERYVAERDAVRAGACLYGPSIIYRGAHYVPFGTVPQYVDEARRNERAAMAVPTVEPDNAGLSFNGQRWVPESMIETVREEAERIACLRMDGDALAQQLAGERVVAGWPGVLALTTRLLDTMPVEPNGESEAAYQQVEAMVARVRTLSEQATARAAGVETVVSGTVPVMAGRPSPLDILERVTRETQAAANAAPVALIPRSLVTQPNGLLTWDSERSGNVTLYFQRASGRRRYYQTREEWRVAAIGAGVEVGAQPEGA